jgi:outer membrane lipoprotein-sorting protein
LGEVKTIDLTIPQPGQKNVPSDAASVQRGKELLALAQKAMGGADQLASIKDISTISRSKLNTPQGAMEIGVTAEMIRPGTARVTQELPVGKIILFTDGKSYWMSSPQGTSDQVPPPVMKQMRGEQFRDLTSLVLSDRVPGRTVTAVGENEVQVADQDGESARLEFDPQTGLPTTLKYTSAQGPSTATYSDWREVGGIRLPFQRAAKMGGMDAVSTVSDVKINSGLSAEALSKKP